MNKVITLVGSPRTNGNTVKIVEHVDAMLKEKDIQTEIVILDHHDMYPCHNCGSCEETGDCIQKDSMTDLWKRIEESDGLILASPTYYSAVTAQMKIFIDRTGRAKVIWDYKNNRPAGTRFSRGKAAMIIGVCGQSGERWLKCSLTQMRSLLADLEIPLYSIIRGDGADVGGGLFEGRPEMMIDIEEATKAFLEQKQEIILDYKEIGT
jgi:multimeric flavodoxin WrbA